MPAEWGLEAYVEGRFPSVNSRDTDAIERYHAQLETAQRRAELSPLAWGQSYSLALTTPQPNPRPNSRRVPSVPNSPRISLRLNKPLQTGAGKMSQIWTAVEEKTRTTLVLKIIQPSMCPYPKADRCWSAYVKPADLAHREAWGYERLAHKQGLLVPYFFGLDTITTPSGERAWVLVLEYVPAITFAALLELPSTTFSDTCDLMKLSIDAATEFTSDGWLHMDLKPRNILVTGIPRARGVVFIDLAFTCREPSSEMNPALTRLELYSDIMEYLGFSSKFRETDSLPKFRQWAEANIPNILEALDDED